MQLPTGPEGMWMGGRVRGILVYGWTGILNCLQGQRGCGGGGVEVF